MSTENNESPTLVHLTIDGNAIAVPKGTTVYTAATQLGIKIPIFCYQDRMPPFGACRMCLVEVEKMGKLQTSCTLEVSEGMVVNTQSALATQGRKDILEFLLINHPLDCPICDRGGECPLQEQALSDGPGKSRFFEEKRHFTKAKSLGPVLMLDRERCITCARCTRFGDVIAGDHALEFIDRGYKTEVGTPDGGPAESKFIGNTIMICPVGALTSQVYRFRARPWDNDSVRSTCTLCPVGCSLNLDSRDGEIVRTRVCENREVNDIWLCDKGWFGYEYTSSSERLTSPLIRLNGKLQPARWEEALSFIASKMIEAKPKGKLAALGGNPLTIEENYLLQKLMREGLNTSNVDHRVGMSLLKDENLSGMEISLEDCEKLSSIVLLGIDLTEEFPVIWLRLKQAINRGAKVTFIGHFAPEIASHCTKVILHTPGEELEKIDQLSKEWETKEGKQAIFVGRQYLASQQRQEILSRLKQLKTQQNSLSINFLEGQGNSWGARFAGMHPHRAPEGESLQKPGLNTLEILQESAKNGWDFLYVVGANLATKCSADLWKKVREKTSFLVVQDLFLTETALLADVVLPALSYVEKGGHFLNIEGRVQRLLPGKEIPNGLYSDGEIFQRLANKLNLSLEITPQFLALLKPNEKIPVSQTQANPHEEAETNSKEISGLKVTFAAALFDHGVRMRQDTHLIQLAKEPKARIHSDEGLKLGIKNNDLVNVMHNNKSLQIPIRFDDKVALNTLVLPLGFPEFSIYELTENPLNGLVITIQKVGGDHV